MACVEGGAWAGLQREPVRHAAGRAGIVGAGRPDRPPSGADRLDAVLRLGHAGDAAGDDDSRLARTALHHRPRARLHHAERDALVGEFSSPAHRVKRMMLVSCGFTLGAALGGFISAALIPSYGWRAVFWVGGTVPLLLAFAMLAALPESLQFLVLKGREARALRWLARFDPRLPIHAGTRLVVREKDNGGAPVAELFRAGRGPVTLILWAISFMNLIDLYFLSNWLPTVMRDAGYTAGTAVIVGTVLQTGGVVGTLLLGWFIERFGFVRVLFVCFAGAALTVGTIGTVAHALPWLLVVVFAGGFCVVGGQPAVNALAGHFYPTSLRSTGIGWSLGIGRIGSVIGPLVGGQLIALDWSNAALFHAAAVPVLCSALLVIALAGATRQRD